MSDTILFRPTLESVLDECRDDRLMLLGALVEIRNCDVETCY